MRLDQGAYAPFFLGISCIMAGNYQAKSCSAQERNVSAMRYPNRLAQSIALVETIVDQVLTNHTSIKLYGLKKNPPSYDVWVKLKNTSVTIQAFTREIIIACTDPDAETAVKFQSFIERGIRQGLKAVITDVH
jgi:hypothetical protein